MEREYGKIIRRGRDRIGMGLRKFADEIGVRFTALSKVEIGEVSRFDGRTSRRIASLLGISHWRLAAATLKDLGWDDVPSEMDERADHEEMAMGTGCPTSRDGDEDGPPRAFDD